MPSPPETVLFDLDDTLCSYDQDADAVLDESFASAGVDRFCDPSDLWALADDVPDAEDDHGFLSMLFARAADRYGGPAGAAADLARAYEAALDHSRVSFRPGAERALALTRERADAVGLVTNGSPRTQRPKLDALGVADAFETVVFAGADTAPKPDPEPFERALEALGTRPASGLYVGNSLTDDVAGAQGVGLRAAWYPAERQDGDPGEHDPDHVFETLADIERVLAE